MRQIFYPLLTLLIVCIAACSHHDTYYTEMLTQADEIMESRPDSALMLLKNVDASQLALDERARYALLMSMALDKNYIDTTTFDVLQPAIDYYPENGTPDEILKTFYYQGRIFQNRNDCDSALYSFYKGLSVAKESCDSLFIARSLVAQAIIFRDFLDIKNYRANYEKAASLYKKMSLKALEFDCILQALNGSILLEDKVKSDSLLALCRELGSIDEELNVRLKKYFLSYAIRFGSQSDIRESMSQLRQDSLEDNDWLLSMSLAFNRLGENDQAKRLLIQVKESGSPYDTIKWQVISVYVLRDLCEYENAFAEYWNLNQKLDSIDAMKLTRQAYLLTEKYVSELNAREEARQKSVIIWGCIGGVCVSILLIVLIYYRYRIGRSKRIIAEHENAQLLLRQQALIKENEILELSHHTAELEADNLRLELSRLTSEQEDLKEMLATQAELTAPVQEIIKNRLEILNGLLAKEISSNDSYAASYNKWVESIKRDKAEFMNSTRLTFAASHPNFIRHLQSHGLTEDEINYVCLYALGLRGKEVGEYIQLKRHYNISCEIRKKLGVDEHSTNLGIYVRRLMRDL